MSHIKPYSWVQPILSKQLMPNRSVIATFLQNTNTTTIVNSTITYGSGQSNQVYDLGGVTYQRGSSLGDKELLRLLGTNNVLKNFNIDDSNLSGVTGVASIGGVDNRIEDATLDNCQRYGFIFVGANRAILRRLTIKKGQHCISGSSGYVGDWRNPSIDCIIENCNISGMIIDGIKLKQMLRTIVRNNVIDVYPKYPGYDGGTTTYSKSGIYFAGTDTANKDCVIENNTVIQSLPTPSGLSNNRAVLINSDQTAVPDVFSSGNKVINNTFKNVYTGAWIRGNNYYLANNAMTGVTVPYDNDGTGNIII